ncbi:hypothetical protein [Niastella yeongjuensis]|nr:hypothetical protein [Niastella yeongjuensis]
MQKDDLFLNAFPLRSNLVNFSELKGIPISLLWANPHPLQPLRQLAEDAYFNNALFPEMENNSCKGKYWVADTVFQEPAKGNSVIGVPDYKCDKYRYLCSG